MVTLRVTGNLDTNVAKLNEYQLSQLRQAADYYTKAMKIMDSIIFSDEFRAINRRAKGWTDAHAAVSNFMYDKRDALKKEIIYEEATNA